MLSELRLHHASSVDEHGTDGMLHASLDVIDPKQQLGDRVLRLRHGIDLRESAAELSGSKVGELVDPAVNAFALRGLKFSAALPEALAMETIARADLGTREDRQQCFAEPEYWLPRHER